MPAALLMFAFGLLIYIGAFYVTIIELAVIDTSPEMVAVVANAARVPADSLSTEEFYTLATLYTAQTSLVTFFVLTGVLTMVFAEPPLRWFAGGAPYRGHWLTAASALALIAAYYILLLWPLPRAFFELVPLPLVFHVAILVMTVLWALLLRMMWRRNWLGRFLDMPTGDAAS
ncbi:MAG: hypothetical protein R6W76_16125 [Caldilinea sp.]